MQTPHFWLFGEAGSTDQAAYCRNHAALHRQGSKDYEQELSFKIEFESDGLVRISIVINVARLRSLLSSWA
jgi:hypothetical protein